MNFPEKYKTLNKDSYSKGEYSIVPIRFEDRLDIMQWRNEQMYHLRQSSLLTKVNQENYFKNVIANLFDKENPDQILFSYLKEGKCIGYGGLVHINWIDRNAEISFIMKTDLEEEEFHIHWGIYLSLIEEVAFYELKLHKLFTYAFDLRPHLYEVLEEHGYKREAVLEEHCFFNEQYIDCIVHSKIKGGVTLRELNKLDEKITFDWANDEVTRINSFNSKTITFEEHSKWFKAKINNANASYFICEVDNKPAGLVRFDFDEKNNVYVIGITIDEKFRGKKLSVSFLKLACKKLSEYCEKTIVAFIKKENIPSVKAFERAGFILESKEKINALEALKYVYQNE